MPDKAHEEVAEATEMLAYIEKLSIKELRVMFVSSLCIMEERVKVMNAIMRRFIDEEWLNEK